MKTSKEARQVFEEIRNYLAGQFVGATRDESILQEIIKCLFVAKFANQDGGKFPLEESDHIQTARYFRRVFDDVAELYQDLFSDGEQLLLGPEELSFVMRRLWDIDLAGSSDVIGDAYEAFIGSSLRGQEGQFFTPRNAIGFLVDAVSPAVGEAIIDPACGTGGFLSKAALAIGVQKCAAGDVQLYGVDKDESLVRLSKTHLALLGLSYKGVHSFDSLSWCANGQPTPPGIPGEGQYDVVLTNPPFGARIVAAKPAVAGGFDLAYNWKELASGEWERSTELRKRLPPQLLFLEKCLRLLKPGGRCGMVVPESLLSSSRYRFAVDYLMRNAEIQLVAGMPESLFKTSGKGGTHTKTALLVFTKRTSSEERFHHSVFFAEAGWCGNDSRGRVIARDDLPRILSNFKRGQKGAKPKADLLGFWIPQDEIEALSLSPRRYNPQLKEQLARLSETHAIRSIGELVEAGVLELKTGDEVGKLAYGNGDVPFVRTSEISNWEIKYNPKHLVDEDVYESLKAKQDVQVNDILMVKDGTYLIGTCGLVTARDTRIVYQSHLYKIRVIDREVLSPHFLLAALSSGILQAQIQAKRVTHDIIDSLGSRVNELLLPIPMDWNVQRHISATVERAMSMRMEARDLGAKAMQMVSLGQLSESMSSSPSSK